MYTTYHRSKRQRLVAVLHSLYFDRMQVNLSQLYLIYWSTFAARVCRFVKVKDDWILIVIQKCRRVRTRTPRAHSSRLPIKNGCYRRLSWIPAASEKVFVDRPMSMNMAARLTCIFLQLLWNVGTYVVEIRTNFARALVNRFVNVKELLNSR